MATPSWWPGHLNMVKVWLAIVVVGGIFVAMHGFGHRWDAGVCNICRMMQ